METKLIQSLKAGRGKEKYKIKNWNLDLKERYIFLIRDAIQGKMGSEADFD